MATVTTTIKLLWSTHTSSMSTVVIDYRNVKYTSSQISKSGSKFKSICTCRGWSKNRLFRKAITFVSVRTTLIWPSDRRTEIYAGRVDGKDRQTDRRTDRRHTFTLRLPLDAASLIIIIITTTTMKYVHSRLRNSTICFMRNTYII